MAGHLLDLSRVERTAGAAAPGSGMVTNAAGDGHR